MKKILIFTRHTAQQFGVKRLKLISKLYGKKVQIFFESIRFTHDDRFKNIEDCITYFKQKVEEGYFCYVVLPRYLKEALLLEGISFGVITKPREVCNGYKITLEHYESKNDPEIKIEKVLARNDIRKKNEHLGYCNNPQKKKRY